MTLRFAKYEGLGNDFVIVEGEQAARARPLATAICDRHRGVGADGLLLVSKGDRYRMEVINGDGSRAEMCGNGLRCVALYLQQRGYIANRTGFVVDTDAGPHPCKVEGDGQVKVQMAAPSFSPAALPVTADGPQIEASWAVGDRRLALTCVSMGNPHVVCFEPVGAERATLGQALASDPRFPAGVNVGFASFDGADRIVLHVLERGSGWTQACGTGACAAAAAAVATGRAPFGKALRVQLPGGELVIRVPGEDEPIEMTGPARHVFDGVYAL